MGFINRFDLNRLIQEYSIINFFETGTWKGDAVAYALQFPFKKIISAEIVGSLAIEAEDRFRQEPRVIIISGDSSQALSNMLPGLEGNIIFWLDAHFPGADAGLVNYDAEQDEDIRLPLERELEVISKLRSGYNDILIIDDLRVYEEGPFENGAAPLDTLPKKSPNLDFAGQLFGETHFVLKSYQNEGYMLLLPKIPAENPGSNADLYMNN
jgi:hypothetical protein